MGPLLANEEPVLERDIQGLLDSLNETLNLYHWTIKYKIEDDARMKKSLMKVIPSRARSLATIYIRRSLLGRPTKEFGPLLLHELLHLVLDPMMEEYEYQLEYEVSDTRLIEYQRRLTRCLERTVEHLTNSLSVLLQMPIDPENKDTLNNIKAGLQDIKSEIHTVAEEEV